MAKSAKVRADVLAHSPADYNSAGVICTVP